MHRKNRRKKQRKEFIQIWTIVKRFNILVFGVLKQKRQRIEEKIYWGEILKFSQSQ